jgi:hypothetical protein
MKKNRPVAALSPHTTNPRVTRNNWFFFESDIIGLNNVPADTGLVEILENSPRLQAVRQRETGVIQAVFYRAGTLRHSEGWSIRTDRPCALQLRPDEKGRCHLTVTNSDSTSRRIRIHLQFFGHDQTHSISLPSGVNAGSSVTQIL